MRKRSLLFLVTPILALVLVGALLYAMRSAQPAANAAANLAGTTPAVLPAATLPAPVGSPPASASTVAAPPHQPAPEPTPADPSSVDSAAPQDTAVVAVVASGVLTRARFELVQAVDSVMAGMLGMEPATADSLLEQMINHELVAQQMAASGGAPAVDSAARLQELLAGGGKTESELDAALAAAGVKRAEFDGYFAELLAVEAFARQSAAASGGDMDAYIAGLQANAHISYGPAAAAVRQAPPVRLAQTAGAENAGSIDGADEEPATSAPDTTSAAAATAAAGAESRGLGNGQLAPDFTLPVLGQEQTQATFADLLGKPTVLSFWTTWCPYCLRQTPILVAAAEEHAQAVRFVGINVAEDAAAVTPYVEQHQIPYTVLLDQESRAAAAYGVEGYPTTWFLDDTGRIVAHHIGALSAEQLTQYLEQLLTTQ